LFGKRVFAVQTHLKERARIDGTLAKEYGISFARGYWTKVVFSANGAASLQLAAARMDASKPPVPPVLDDSLRGSSNSAQGRKKSQAPKPKNF
jgi:hypothetical protein